MEDVGIITGYGARIDPSRLGFGLTILIRGRPFAGRDEEHDRGEPRDTSDCGLDRVSGDDCFVARAHVCNVAEMEAVIDRIVPFGATISSVVQSTPVTDSWNSENPRRMTAVTQGGH
ncbi:Lrp/AsnC family transcriptional regulator [Borborobacter arsenicus]|uniref:Lrp/AsnC family transcriptional regulator n=1 Tax=Borborobacter arsenicus TaxID=1851146 RepID=UPI001AECE7A7|nr:Lrp/AsnC family transcriptional regulator [Pseudaminobacter arsenicus]